jgi:hypothetical protein
MDRPTEENRSEGRVALDAWLKDNVRNYPGVTAVVLKDFSTQFGKSSYEGAFKVSFKPYNAEETFSFSAEGTGQVMLGAPYFHSPLGVPITCSAIDLEPEVSRAISVGIRALIPPLKPLGLDPETQSIIVYGSPLKQRLTAPLALIEKKLSNRWFRLHVCVKTLKLTEFEDSGRR